MGGERAVLRPVVRGSRERGQLRTGKGTHGGLCVSGVPHGSLVTTRMPPGVAGLTRLRCLWVSVSVVLAGHGADYPDVWV